MVGTFTKNTIFTMAARGAEILFGVGISIIIARMLGPEGKGIYSLAILLPGLLVTFANLGINPATVFYTARRKYSLKEILGNNVIIAAIISSLALLIGAIIAIFFSHELFPGVEKQYLLLALCLVPLALFSDFISHILIGLQKLKVYNVIYFLNAFLYLILIIALLLWLHLGIGAAISAQIIALAIVGMAYFYCTKRETEGISLSANTQYLRDASFYGFKAHIAGLVTFLHYRADLFLINLFLNTAAVGYYSIAVSVAEGMWFIPRSAGIALFPKVASETNPADLKQFTPLVCRNVLLIAIIVAILLFAVSHWLVLLLYSETFLESIQPLRILLIGAVAISGQAVLVQSLMAQGRQMLVSYISGASLLLNIILNIVLIPPWGISGAAWASTVSYSVAFVITALLYGKISGNTIKDIVLPQKSDLQYYRNFLQIIRSFKNIEV